MGIEVKQQLHIKSATIGADTDRALRSVDSAIGVLRIAVDVVKAGGNHKPTFEVSNKVAADVYSALAAFLEGRPLLTAGESASMNTFAQALGDKAKVADAATKSVLEAQRAQLTSGGAVEYNMSDLGAWNDRMLATKLIETADKTGKPAFAEYFGALMVVKPGAFGGMDAAHRADLVHSQFQEEVKPNVASTLRNAAQQAARRVEISEGQAKPMRSLDDITKASQDRAEKQGYGRDSLAGQIGYAISDMVHHGEIDMFANHLVKLALKNDDVMSIADPAARLDRARDRAAYWVGHYGRNEKVIDNVWYASLSKHIDALKLDASGPTSGRSIDDITKASQDRAEKQGYKRDSLAGLIGYALQDLTDKDEINAFARHLLGMALKNDDIAKIASGPERLDRARDRAGSWVNHFGKNDRAIDAMWYGALHAHVEEMKGVPKEVTQAKVEQQEAEATKRVNARAAEIADAQTKPMRSIEDITKASQDRAEKQGYKRDGLAGLVGYALQDLMHHGEIDAFARHMLGMALKNDDVAKIEDKGERIDRARDRAGSWVNHYGRNEREIDAVWYASLAKHADAMKG